MSKPMLTVLATAGVFMLPSLAQARPVAFEVKLKNYGGDGAYLALYVTDKAGAYKGTLWVAGRKSKYHRHLAGWARASRGQARLDGVTGASVGAGRTLKVTTDLADALIDAGFEVHVDAAVENMRDSPDDAKIALTAAGAGKTTQGRGYVASLAYHLP